MNREVLERSNLKGSWRLVNFFTEEKTDRLTQLLKQMGKNLEVFIKCMVLVRLNIPPQKPTEKYLNGGKFCQDVSNA